MTPEIEALLAEIKDQNGKSLERQDGESLLFVVGDKNVPKETELWADKLEAHLPESCRVVRLLDLQEVPRAGGPLVRRKIRKQIGDQPKRVFLDWEGLVAHQFGIRIDIPVIVCLDDQDALVEIVEGEYSDSLRARIEGLYP